MGRWRAPLAIGLILLAQASIELAMGRVPWCTCGTIKLWYGLADGPETSQQLTDWYTPTHVIHGFLLYGAARFAWPSWSVASRLVAAMSVEGLWEVIENTPLIIDRYRAATVSLGYQGDSVLNSLSDSLACLLGFCLAGRLPRRITIGLALSSEIFLGLMIRDNLTLNILMLLYPADAIRRWQMG